MELDLELCRNILQKIELEGGIDGLEKFPHIQDQELEEDIRCLSADALNGLLTEFSYRCMSSN